MGRDRIGPEEEISLGFEIGQTHSYGSYKASRRVIIVGIDICRLPTLPITLIIS